MDQRREPRFAANQSITVTLLGEDAGTETAIVRNASSRGLAIAVANPVAPGTALKIEFEDGFVLGEAVYCRRESESYFVGIELDQVLCGLSALGRKLQELADRRDTRATGSAPLETPPAATT